MPEAAYVRVVKQLVAAIHAEDRGRLIIADGLRWANRPVPALAPLGIAQSTHCYHPMQLTHYQAGWVHGDDKWPEPAWPLKIKEGDVWDKARLRQTEIAPWVALTQRGVGVHVGEWGAYNRTPHAVVLAWMRDKLDLFKRAGFGWALWNFRGSFGIVDSDRADVRYEDWHGHHLDRWMLELLRKG